MSLLGQFRLPRDPLGRLAGLIAARRRPALAEWGIEALQVRAGERVLEIGCGAGAGLTILARTGAARVVGVDPSVAMLRRAGRRLRSEGLLDDIELLNGAAERLALADASFDAILAVDSVPFWTDPAAGLAEARRVLRPGGRIVTVLQPRWARTTADFERAASTEHERLVAAGFDVLPPLVKSLRPVEACLLAGSVRTSGALDAPASGPAPARAGCTS